MLRESTESLPQRILVTLLAEFLWVVEAPIPSNMLVEIFEDFGISSDTTRTALSRLVAKGILRRLKTGRSTSYMLSDTAMEMIREDTHRILRFGEQRTWNGEWTLVAFSVAESLRERRHALRSQLRALGFASLFDGLWAAAFATVEEAQTALIEADVPDSIVVRGSIEASGGKMEQFHAAWKLDALAAEYRGFIARVAPLVARAERGDVSPAEALLVRTRIMDDWRAFPLKDPDLPSELLPPDWPRQEARDLFRCAYELLGPASQLRLRMLSGLFDKAR